MNRILKFIILIFKDVAPVAGVVLFIYGCTRISDFIEAFPTFTLYSLVTAMGLCVLAMLLTWFNTQWENTKE
jgi:hypothetical protein